MAIIDDILKKVHRKFSKDTDYPEAGNEDLMVRLDHLDDAISEWEDCVDDGYIWPELITNVPFTFNGTGIDLLPENFRAFITRFNKEGGGFEKAQLQIGSSIFINVTASEGSRMAQEGLAPNVFWQEGKNLRTLPSTSATIDFPYVKKATRFPLGTEVAVPEMKNTKFIEDYVLAKVFLDNSDNTLYQSNFLSADEKLKKMKYNALA